MKPTGDVGITVHKKYQHGDFRFLLCNDKLAAGYTAPLRARSARTWNLVTCKRCLRKKP